MKQNPMFLLAMVLATGCIVLLTVALRLTPVQAAAYASPWTGSQGDTHLETDARRPSPVEAREAGAADDLTIRVDYADDRVVAHASPSATVAITVAGAAGVKAIYAGQADGQGWLFTEGTNWNPTRPNIVPGDTVTGSVPGTVRSLDVGRVDALVNADANTVAGQIHAPWIGGDILNVECKIYVDGEGHSVWASGVSGNGGAYQCDFAGTADLHAGVDVEVYYYEPPSGATAAGSRFSTPVMRVNYAEDTVGGDYSAGHTFLITVTNGSGAVKATATTDSIVWQDWKVGGWWGRDGFQLGNAGWTPAQPDILPGDHVLFSTDTGYTNDLEIGVLDGVIDVDANTISGTVSAPWVGQTMETWCFPSYPAPPFLFQASSAAPDGTAGYSCSPDPAAWDLVPEDEVYVRYVEPHGDTVINVLPAPNTDAHLNLRAFSGQVYVEGHTTADKTVWVTLMDEEGNYKDSASASANQQGEFYIHGGTGFAQRVEPTDWVLGVSADGASTAMQAVRIEGTVDVETNTVSGSMQGPGATFPAQGMVRVHTPGDQWIVWDLEIDSEGLYSLALGDKHHLVSGDEVQVFYGSWLANQTERSFWIQGQYLPMVINR